MINAVEKIQIEAARIITGTSKLVSLEKLYNETCWETLEQRRQKHKLYLFYKMSHNLTPDYLASLSFLLLSKAQLLIGYEMRQIFRIGCDPSSEPSQQDGSDEGSQHMVSTRNKIRKKYHLIQILPPD